MSEKAPGTLPSPCVRNCCLDDDDVCLGCFRRIEEITGWAAMDDAERAACLSRCEQRRHEAGNRHSWRDWPSG